jgi:hypothetical protein
MNALCEGRPPQWWDTGNDHNLQALALCARCPLAGTCKTAGEPVHGVILDGVAYNDKGDVARLCRCGQPISNLPPHTTRCRACRPVEIAAAVEQYPDGRPCDHCGLRFEWTSSHPGRRFCGALCRRTASRTGAAPGSAASGRHLHLASQAALDDTNVDQAVAGHIPASSLTQRERAAAVRILAGRGLNDREIGRVLRWGPTEKRAAWAIFSVRRSHHIPSGYHLANAA